MPIFDIQTALPKVLKEIAARRRIVQIRKYLRREFKLTRAEVERKQKNGVRVYRNRIAWALVWLLQGRAIIYIKPGVYQLTSRGRALLAKGESLTRADVLGSTFTKLGRRNPAA